MGSSRSGWRGGSASRAAGKCRARRLRMLATSLAVYAVVGCTSRARVHPSLVAMGDTNDPLAVSDAVERLIAQGEDTPEDREYAYELVQRGPQDTASSLFARAAVTGRLVQLRGLRAADLLRDVERSARRSRELDPDFRDGAATRLLGTLYVMAPAMLLEHGNSEEGLELLEGLTTERPSVLENHLRLAEAYISLGDPQPASPHLCRCLQQKTELRPDEQQLLAQLVTAAGPLPCLPSGQRPF